jgi:peptidoglycan/LPS O-acetylase OafA/YrhL
LPTDPPQLGPPRSRTITALTGLRGYAALWVVLSHVSFTDSLSQPLVARLSWGRAEGILRHEYLAVDLFFILSGFVLTHAHGRELDGGFDRRSYVRFLLLRLARVYPLHLLALAHATLISLVVPSFLENTVASFLLQLLLMASWGFCQTLSWNGPAWSLSSEWLAYIALPLMILVSAGLRRVRAQLLGLGLIITLFGGVFFGFLWSHELLLQLNISNGAGANARVLLGVAIGCVLRRLYDHEKVRALPWTPIFWLSLPLSAAFMTDLSGRRLDNSLWAYLAVILVVFAAACASPRALAPFTSRVPVYVGEISYAIYIFHYPVLLTLRWLAGARLDALAASVSASEAPLIVLGAVVVVMVVAVVAHHLVEKPARNLARRWIDRHYPPDLGASATRRRRDSARATAGDGAEGVGAAVGE